jgi:hypothetical protein
MTLIVHSAEMAGPGRRRCKFPALRLSIINVLINIYKIERRVAIIRASALLGGKSTLATTNIFAGRMWYHSSVLAWYELPLEN